MQEDIVRLIILLEAVYQQSSTLNHSLKHSLKRKFNNFDQFVGNMLKEFKANIDPVAYAHFEAMSILHLETVRELDRSVNAEELVSLMRAYNDGFPITIGDKENEPYTSTKNPLSNDEHKSIDHKESVEPVGVSA